MVSTCVNPRPAETSRFWFEATLTIAPTSNPAADGTPIVVQPKTAFVCNNIGMVRESALAGMGIATLSAYLVEDDIRTGRLQRIMPEYHLADREFRIVYSSRKFQSLKVKAFIDIAIEHFRQANE